MKTTNALKARRLSTPQVCQAAGVSYRKLDYWLRLGLIPGVEPNPGSGRSRTFTPLDVVIVRVVAALVTARADHSSILESASIISRNGVVPDFIWVWDHQVGWGDRALLDMALVESPHLLVVNVAVILGEVALAA